MIPMDNYQALQSFWESFGVEAYDDQTVFNEGNLPAFPHITYESASGGYLNSATLSASIWDRTATWGFLKQKAEEIKRYIGYGGKQIKTDGGYLWIKLPESTRFDWPEDSGEDGVLRIRINIEVDFLTT